VTLTINACFPALRYATQRNATQAFLRIFFMQPQTPQRRLLLLAALRKQIETTSIFGEIRAKITFNQWLRHCGMAGFVA